MNLIVATNNIGYIGKDGKMLWYSKDDLKHFKRKTTGAILIVGSTTFEICLNGKFLPDRTTYVIGKNYMSVWDMLDTICMLRKAYNNNKIWVIGGSQIYDTFVHLCDEIHISHINNNDVGDATFTIPTNYKGKVFDYYFDESTK